MYKPKYVSVLNNIATEGYFKVTISLHAMDLQNSAGKLNLFYNNIQNLIENNNTSVGSA
jgi:hypothetical protein